MNNFYEELKRISQKSQNSLEKKLIQAYAEALKEVNKKVRLYIVDNMELSFAQQLEMKRNEALMREIYKRLDLLYDDNYKVQVDSEVNEFINQYMGIFYEVENTLKISLDFAMISDKYIKQAIDLPVAGLKLSERLYEKQLPELKLGVKQAITQGLILGTGYNGIASQVADTFNISMNNALRIARTETARIRSTARQEGQQEAVNKGVKLEKKWVSTLDDRTREDHQELDGQIVPIDKPFKLGIYEAMQPRMFGIAKEDINCRCDTITIVEGFEPGIRRDNISKEVIDYKNYKEWAKSKGLDVKGE